MDAETRAQLRELCQSAPHDAWPPFVMLSLLNSLDRAEAALIGLESAASRAVFCVMHEVGSEDRDCIALTDAVFRARLALGRRDDVPHTWMEAHPDA